MSDQIPSTPSSTREAYYEDEIDLRQYLDILIQWWKEIVFITVGLSILAGLGVLALRLLPPSYEASADVAIVRVQSDVSFDERFTTTSDEQLSTSNAAARRSALFGQASSAALAQEVIKRVGDVLTPSERNVDELVKEVEINSAPNGTGRTADSDLIRITVRANSPEKAEKLATTWAEVFVETANSVYGQTPDDLLRSVEESLIAAQSDYDSVQKKLEAFVATNRSDELSRQVAIKEQIVNTLQEGEKDILAKLTQDVIESRRDIVQTVLQFQADNQKLLFSAEQQGQQDLLHSYIDAKFSTQLAVFQEQVKRGMQLLQDYYATSRRTETVLESAKILRQQIADGSETVEGGSVLTLQLLKLQAFTNLAEQTTQASTSVDHADLNRNADNAVVVDSAEAASTAVVQPVQVQLDLPDASPLQLQLNANAKISKTDALVDIDSLIAVLEGRVTSLNAQISSLSDRLLKGDNYTYLQPQLPSDSGLAEAIQAQNGVLLSEVSTTARVPISDSTSHIIAQLLPALSLPELQDASSLYGTNDVSLSGATEQIENEIRELKSQLETEQAKQKELNQQRDLAWSTFTTISNKVAELRLSRAAAGSEVRFAAAAVAPQDPVDGPSLILAVAAGGILGLFLATLYAFLANYLGQRPFLSKRQIVAVSL